MAADPEREQRFLDLVTANRPRLVRIAQAYAGSDWADLHQDILLQVWRGLESFKGLASPATWLYRVALNTAMTWRRKAAPARAVIAAPGVLPEPSGEVSPRGQLHLLEEFLGTLGAVDRAILLLYLEDARYVEIAEVTGLSESNVGVRINRMKRAFVVRYIGD